MKTCLFAVSNSEQRNRPKKVKILCSLLLIANKRDNIIVLKGTKKSKNMFARFLFVITNSKQTYINFLIPFNIRTLFPFLFGVSNSEQRIFTFYNQFLCSLLVQRTYMNLGSGKQTLISNIKIFKSLF